MTGISLTCHPLTRRQATLLSLAGALGTSVGLHGITAAADLPLLTRTIPSTGETLPVIGIGTNRYDVGSPADLAERRAVLEKLPQLGLSVVDTAPLYGRSEAVIGQLVAGIGNRARLFIATKIIARGARDAEASLQDSLAALRTDHLDLLQVHNLVGVETLLPLMRQWQRAGRIRYTGMTTSNVADHPRLLDYMRRFKPDFVQVDYSLGNRGAADNVLPAARDLGVAVVGNTPFGGRRNAAAMFARVAGRPLPPWAAQIQAASWSQVFLKYVVSHPAITVTVPGTTELVHLEDNADAGQGTLPDASLRRTIEQFWDSLPG